MAKPDLPPEKIRRALTIAYPGGRVRQRLGRLEAAAYKSDNWKDVGEYAGGDLQKFVFACKRLDNAKASRIIDLYRKNPDGFTIEEQCGQIDAVLPDGEVVDIGEVHSNLRTFWARLDGQVPDSVLAEWQGTSQQAVQQRRQAKGVRAYAKPGKKVSNRPAYVPESLSEEIELYAARNGLDIHTAVNRLIEIGLKEEGKQLSVG